MNTSETAPTPFTPTARSPWRRDFPQMVRKVSGREMIYLDSAATSLKPWSVIERVGKFYSYESANVHRGAHRIADEMTSEFEQVRTDLASWLGATQREEIIFTRGTTESINLVAQSWGRSQLRPGDVIVTTEMEHHANIVPWQQVALQSGAKLHAVRLLKDGSLDEQHYLDLLKLRPRLVALTHCSNVLGCVLPIREWTKLAHSAGALVLVDGAQMVAHHSVNVQELDCDFYVFSGHKMFGPTGVGVLWGRYSLLAQMPPYQTGGSMISEVHIEKTTYQDPPFRFEAGTPHIEGVVGLGSALAYLKSLPARNVADWESELLGMARAELGAISGVRILSAPVGAPLVSFVMEGVHPSDLSSALDQQNLAVRAGHLCAQPLLRSMGLQHAVRASFSIYNQPSDVLALAAGVRKAKEIFS